MNEDTEEEQMQCGGRGGVSRAARGRFDGFADGVYICFLLLPALGCFGDAE